MAFSFIERGLCCRFIPVRCAPDEKQNVPTLKESHSLLISLLFIEVLQRQFSCTTRGAFRKYFGYLSLDSFNFIFFFSFFSHLSVSLRISRSSSRVDSALTLLTLLTLLALIFTCSRFFVTIAKVRFVLLFIFYSVLQVIASLLLLCNSHCIAKFSQYANILVEVSAGKANLPTANVRSHAHRQMLISDLQVLIVRHVPISIPVEKY